MPPHFIHEIKTIVHDVIDFNEIPLQKRLKTCILLYCCKMSSFLGGKVRSTCSDDVADGIVATGESSITDPTAFIEQQRQMLREFSKGGDDEKTGSASKLAVAASSEIGPTFIRQQSQSGETKRQLREKTEQNKLQLQLKEGRKTKTKKKKIYNGY